MGIKKIKVVGLVLVLAVLGIFFVLWQQQQAKKEKEPQAPAGQETRQELTGEQKKEVLEKLSAPPGAKQYTVEEKIRILESLSAPQNTERVLDEAEKKRLLDALRNPAK